MKAIKLTTKIHVAFILPALFLGIVGGISIYGFLRINQQVTTIYDDRVVPLKQLKEISDNYAVLVIDSVNKFHSGRISKTEILSNLNKAQGEIEKTWQEYRQTSFSSQEALLAKEIESLFIPANRAIDQLEQVLEKADQTTLKQQLERLDGGLYEVIDPLTAKIQEDIELQLAIAESERELATTIVDSSLKFFITMLSLFAFLVIWPIRVFINRAIVSTLKETINVVASSASEIAAASEEQQRLTEQQSESVTKTTTTMDQLQASSQQSAQQAETSAAGAQKILSLSHQGDRAVENTLKGMTELKARVTEISDSINQLTEQLGQIDIYQKLLAEIANQTNMLALNAAVEAVRAGEHGKGFGVVATEIRKLADQSKQSANKINGLVNNIRQAMHRTVQATDLGIKTVQDGVETVNTTAQTFQQVVVAIDEIVVSSQQISLTAKEQAIAISQIVNTMNDLSQAARETANGINQTKLGNQKLTETANYLQEMV